MRGNFVGLIAGLVALAGFAGSANASATIDLIWVNSGKDTTTAATTSSLITLEVILTAGAGGSLGAAVSVDYTNMLTDYSIDSFSSVTSGPLPVTIPPTNNTGTMITNINAGGFVPMAAGQSVVIGTITFHIDNAPTGPVQIDVGTFVITDAVLDGLGNDISSTTTFSSGFATVPEPGTLSLLGMGLSGLYVVGRRSSRKR